MSRTSLDADVVASTTTSRQLVVFSLGGEEFALPIATVSENIHHAASRSVASDVPGVRGVIGLRGKLIPIVDLAERLGLPATQADADETGKIVILDTDGAGQVGATVDAVDEVLTISSEQIDWVPTAGDAIEAIAKVEDRLVMTLDATALAPEVKSDTPVAVAH